MRSNRQLQQGTQDFSLTLNPVVRGTCIHYTSNKNASRNQPDDRWLARNLSCFYGSFICNALQEKFMTWAKFAAP
jgi:hypothetical protein